MELTLPLISFLFVCLIFPKIVRNRPQFYISFGLLVLILLFNILAQIFSTTGFTSDLEKAAAARPDVELVGLDRLYGR